MALPTVLQKEKVLPFSTVVSFKLEQVIEILFCLSESFVYILVVKLAISTSATGAGFSSLFEKELSGF